MRLPDNSIASAAEVNAARQSIDVFSSLRGQRNFNDNQRTEMITSRIMLLRQARALQLNVSDEDVGRFGARMTSVPPQKDEDQVMYQQRLKREHDSLMARLAAEGISGADFDRILREDLIVNQLQHLLSTAGKTTPEEIRQTWEFIHEKMTISIVRFKSTDALLKVAVTDDDAKKFFESDPAPFALPEKVKVRYLRLDLEDAKKEVILTEDELRAAYEKNKVYFTDDKGQPKPFEAVRGEIENFLKSSKAADEIKHRALKMMQEIAPAKTEIKPVPFADAAKARNLPILETDFFALNDQVNGVKAGQNFNAEAFKLREDFRFGNPVLGSDGVYVMEFAGRQPRNDKPDFATVKEKVIARLKEVRALEQTQKSGRDAQAKVLAATKQGTPFAQACTAEGLTAAALPPFSLVDQIKDEPNEDTVKSAALQLNPNEISEFTATADGGFILQLAAREPGDPEQLKKDSANIKLGLTQQRKQAAVQDWFGKLTRQAGAESLQ